MAGVLSIMLLAVPPVWGATDGFSPFKQAIAEAAAERDDIANFYRQRNYAPLWTGHDIGSKERRAAFLRAAEQTDLHGLPGDEYGAAALRDLMGSVRDLRALGAVEYELTRRFLGFARDLQTGILEPYSIDPGIVRVVQRHDTDTLLASFAVSEPAQFFASLPPQSDEYRRLLREKLRLEREIESGGYGLPVRARKLEPGDSGASVVALRNRLIRKGYLARRVSDLYDEELTSAVMVFQSDHGLIADGIAGAVTLEAVNTSAETQLARIVVAMERERWLNRPLGDRHIWVNLADFHVRIVDHGKTTMVTRSVVGMNAPDRRSPEFSDEMDHLIVNPTWHVPRSIATREYLPVLQQNPYALRHLMLVDRRGRIVPRDAVDFTDFDEQSFPFDMKEPPSRGNALGLVKFMFPNRHNIYLHDTPAKQLFNREKRDFSHGCIRLQEPFEFAYTLLAAQTDNPEALFHSMLNTGRETRIDLVEPVPVHLVYRTAFTTVEGRMQYRNDVYGRDYRIAEALRRAGVDM